jgi:hypothetical protein
VLHEFCACDLTSENIHEAIGFMENDWEFGCSKAYGVGVSFLLYCARHSDIDI